MGLWRVLSDLEEDGYRTELADVQRGGNRRASPTHPSVHLGLPATAQGFTRGAYKSFMCSNKRRATKGTINCRSGDQDEQNWPTPRAGNPGSRKPGTGGKILAEEAKKNWRPEARMQIKSRRRRRQRGVAERPAQEKSSTSGKNHGSWPTARSSDAEGGRIKTERTEKGFRSKREKSDQYFGAKLRDAAEMEKTTHDEAQSELVRAVDGLTHRVDRLRLLGNGVVPQTAEIAWKSLWRKMDEAYQDE